MKRREQLLKLLAKKFRGKYMSSVISDESNVDCIILTYITRFLEHEQMTEGNLVRLDQRLLEWKQYAVLRVLREAPLDSRGC